MLLILQTIGIKEFVTVHECECCREQLHPSGLFCHRCGQRFDAPVPGDATPPVGQAGSVAASLRGKSPTARATIVHPRRALPKSQAVSVLRTLVRGLHNRRL